MEQPPESLRGQRPGTRISSETFWDGTYLAKAIPGFYVYIAMIHTDQAGGVDANTGVGTYDASLQGSTRWLP
jgi:hypothetical protein